MNKHRSTHLLSLAFLYILLQPTSLKAQEERLNVILKMDDVRAVSANTYNSSWQRLADSIRSYNINAAMGAVLIDLTEGRGSQAFKDSLKSWHESPYFEVWHHGWTHTRNDYPPNNDNAGEFSGTPYSYQKEHFEDGMKYAKDELGITLRTFGAPYNQTDATFSRVIEESPDMKVWLYCADAAYSEMCLFRGSNNKLESSTGVVSYESFLSAYNSNTNSYLVLQGHPGQWTTASFEQFDQIIDFLKEKNARFILPYDLYLEEINNPLVYSQTFKDADSLYINVPLDKIEASQTCCEELKINVKNGSVLAKDEPIIHNIQVNGASTTLDIGETTKVYIRLRAEKTLNLRLDLSDGISATSGANGRLTQSIPAETEEWTLLTYDFPLSSYQEVGLNTQEIREIHLYPNPEEDSFEGTLYIDYISIGTELETFAICRSDIDRDGCAMLFEEQFDDQKVNLFGDFFGAVDTLESGCGELLLTMKESSTLPKIQPIGYKFPEPLDFTLNPKVVVQLRSSARMDLRIDLSDGTNSTDGINGKVFNAVPSNTLKWSILEYNYPQLAFEENEVDSTKITELLIYPNPESDNFPGTLYVDFIAAGIPTGNGNAIGMSEKDSCGIVPVIVDPTPLENHIAENDIHIYPNPVLDKLTIQYDEQWINSKLKVFNLSGEEVYSSTLKNKTYSIFNSSALKKGVYFLQVTKGNKTYLRKILK